MKIFRFDRWLFLTRLFGILLVMVSFGQFVYFSHSRNLQYPVFAFIFLTAIFLSVISTVISVLNSWFYSRPKFYKVLPKFEPKVSVIIPTCGEPVHMIINTLRSVLSQNWPQSKLVVVVSDDGKDKYLEQEIQKIAEKNNNVFYFSPPSHGSAKAGNLNAALNYIKEKHPDIQFVETRDADDLVGNKEFLRLSIGSLLKDKSLSFVQTIKRTKVSKGDPFLNQEKLFYQHTMRYRAAVNSVFPCGSGVVWRLSSLLSIHGFPIWNLVEDLQSGFESLKLGGKGEYLPFVGAIGQSAPEDVPNYYKQRGTWAIDALRLFFWKNAIFAKKLNIWQKLQFFELGFSYLLSPVMFIFIFSITSCLGFEVCPANSNSIELLIISGLFILFMEMYNLVRSRGLSYEETWKIRQTWIGLLPVFAIAAVKAFYYGPNKKPKYKVTRKNAKFGLYLKEVIPQLFFMTLLIFSVLQKFTNSEKMYVTDIILIFWSTFLLYGFSRVIKNSIYGVRYRFVFKLNPQISLTAV